jgi:TetR/AcrR family transcriptional repressor of nem operon
MKRKHDINEILDKGLELIRSRGYNKTGIDDILRESGIPKGSFYNFFKSKEDFGIQAMQQYTERQEKWVRDILSEKNKSPFQRLQKFYQSLIAANREEHCRKGCLVGNMAQEMGGLSEAISQQADDSLKSINALIAQCIEEGQAAGEIRSDYKAQDLADYLHNSFYGFLLRSKAGRDKSHFDIFTDMMFNFLKK